MPATNVFHAKTAAVQAHCCVPACCSAAVTSELVIDHEEITRNGPEGLDQLELAAIYERRDGYARMAAFRFDPRS